MLPRTHEAFNCCKEWSCCSKRVSQWSFNSPSDKTLCLRFIRYRGVSPGSSSRSMIRSFLLLQGADHREQMTGTDSTDLQRLSTIF